MGSDSKISIVVEAIDQATKTLRSVGWSIEWMSRQSSGLSSSLRTLGESVRSTLSTSLKASAVALSWFGLAGVKSAMDFEQTSVALTTMLKDSKLAGDMLKDLSKFAETTPFEFPEIADAGKRLLAFGFSAKEINGTLRSLGDISSALNIPLGELSDIYGKARVQGRLFAEDLNQLTGRGIPVTQELAKQFHVSESAIKDLVEKGKIGFPELQRAFQSLSGEGGKFAWGMEKQSRTLTGLLSTLQDSIGWTLRALLGMKDDGSIEKWSAIEKIKDSVVRLNDYLVKNKDGIIKFVGDIASAAKSLYADIAPVVTSVYEWVKANPKLAKTIAEITIGLLALSAVMPVISTSLSVVSMAFKGAWLLMGGTSTILKAMPGIFGGVMTAIRGAWMAFTFLTWPVGLTILAITAVAWIAYLVYRNWDTIKSKLVGIWLSIRDGIAGAILGLPALAERAKQWGLNMLNMFGDGIASGIAYVKEKVSWVANTISDYLGFHSPTKKGPGSDADKWMPNLMDMLAGGLSDTTKIERASLAIAKTLWKGFDKERLSQLASDLRQTVSQASETIRQSFDDMTSKVGNQKEKLVGLKAEYQSLKEKLKEVGTEGAKELKKLQDQLEGQDFKIKEITGGGKNDVADRALEIEKEIKTLKENSSSWDGTENQKKIEQLQTELALAKAYAGNAAIESQRMENSKSETQHIIDRTLQKMNEAQKEREELRKTMEEKRLAIAEEQADVLKKMEEKKSEMIKEFNLYKSLIVERRKLENEYFAAFQKDIRSQIDKTKEAISLMSQLNGKTWGSARTLVDGARALGWPVDSGRTYLVGENGPELFTPSRSGAVIPNGSFGGGSATINISLGGVVIQEKADVDRLVTKLSEELARRLELTRNFWIA